MSGPEQRVHARIHVSTKIEIATPEGMLEAELKDLSKGGARFEVGRSIGAVGDTVELYLPSLDKGEIAVLAQIIRDHVGAGSMHTYAVRFEVVEPAMQSALLDLIEVLLSASGGGRRAHARVARRVEVRFGHLDDLRGILEDISAGGLLMTVSDPLVLYEEVDVSVPDLAGGALLLLHARVVNQRQAQQDGQTIYRVGLEFLGQRPEAQRLVRELLRTVMEVIEPGEGGQGGAG
jgi:c-di-GMP-binding flagellar brake protein YcgR